VVRIARTYRDDFALRLISAAFKEARWEPELAPQTPLRAVRPLGYRRKPPGLRGRFKPWG